MASFVVDWTTPTTCTSAMRLSKRVTILDGVRPLMNADNRVVFKEAKPGMTVILQEKTEKWSGIIESKWDSFKEAKEREEALLFNSESTAKGAAEASGLSTSGKSCRKAAVAGRAFVKKVTLAADEQMETQTAKQMETIPAKASAVSRKRPLSFNNNTGLKKRKSVNTGYIPATQRTLTESDSSDSNHTEERSEDERIIDLDHEKEEYLKKLKEKSRRARPSKTKCNSPKPVKKVAQDEAVKSFVDLAAVATPVSLESPVCTPPRQKHPQVTTPVHSSPRLHQNTPFCTPPRQIYPQVRSPVRSSPRLHQKTPVCTPPRQIYAQVRSPVRSSPRLYQKTINSYAQRKSPSTPKTTPVAVLPQHTSTPTDENEQASVSGLSVTDHQESLHKALNAMHSVQKNPMGIEQRLDHCEKVLRLLLQVQLAELNCSKGVGKKEDEDSVSQLDVCLKKKAREASKIANTIGDAIRHTAKVLFSTEELITCTVRGRHTNKTVEQRPALDATKLHFLISTVTKVFPNTDVSKINEILGDYLKKNRTRSSSVKKHL